MAFYKKLSPFYNLIVFYVAVSFMLRIILLFHPITDTTFMWTDEINIFIFGLVSDIFVFILATGVLWLYLIFISNGKYLKPYGYIIFGLFVALFLYIASGKSILNEYGGALPKIGLAFVGIKTFYLDFYSFTKTKR